MIPMFDIHKFANSKAISIHQQLSLSAVLTSTPTHQRWQWEHGALLYPAPHCTTVVLPLLQHSAGVVVLRKILTSSLALTLVLVGFAFNVVKLLTCPVRVVVVRSFALAESSFMSQMFLLKEQN